MTFTLDRIDNISYIETMLYSTNIGLAGQVDCIAEFDGVPSIIDFKTSSKMKKEEWIEDYFLQCTAYSLMYEELIGQPINDIVIIMAVENEQPLLFQEKLWGKNVSIEIPALSELSAQLTSGKPKENSINYNLIKIKIIKLNY